MENRTVDVFLTELASGAPTPGGGGASAVCGGIAAALGSMVGNLTSGKKKYAEYQEDIEATIAKCGALVKEFEALGKNPIDECDLYSQYLQYYHLGRMSTVPGRYVDDGRLINEDCEDETDEELYEGEANGKSFLEILNSRAVHLDDDGNIIEKKDGDDGEEGVLQ